MTVTGDPVPLPAAADLAAYRIIQESLTNTIRHAGPATATVRLGYAERRAADRGRPTPAGAHAGHRGRTAAATGCAGMRERAAAAGGTLDRPAPGGGFRVAARLPLRPLPCHGRTSAGPAADQPTAAHPAAEEGTRP